MNDVVWYSRFAVLVGALVLLVQSVTGRAVGFVTLIGVLLLCLGFVVFVVALALQGMRGTMAETAAAVSGGESVVAAGETQTVRARERHRRNPPATDDAYRPEPSTDAEVRTGEEAGVTAEE